jgi:hypothetical protein
MQHSKTGDVVEVKSLDEVLATLDPDGTYEGVPFMPEMHAFCGRRFRVFKRTDKICVEREWLDFRRLRNAVLLEEVRCDGSAHDGCQKLCMIFWKEAWLKPAPAGAEPEPAIDWVTALRSQATCEIDESKTYSCQSTAALHATEPISGWDPRQYIRDIQSGAVRPLDVVRVLFIEAYNKVAKKLGRPDFGVAFGTLTRTPLVQLGLKPGDVVRVKTREEIVTTLDKMGRNRGLGFAYDMERHCAHTLSVITPINRMILENTGKMKKLSHTVLLQGAACTGLCNRGCARNGHPLWREAWLEPIKSAASTNGGSSRSA